MPEQRRFVEQVGNGVLVNGTDSDAIIHGMREVYQRRAQLRLNEARLSDVIDTYGWQAQSRKLLALYEALQ